MPDKARVAAVLDRMALCEAQARYCRALDAKDWDGVAALIAEDYFVEMPGDPDKPELRGRDEALAYIRASVSDAVIVHHVHSPEIEIRGDEATAIWAIHERILWEEGKWALGGYGHYHQRWVREDGAWKLLTLKLARLHMDHDPPAREWAMGVWDESQAARHGKNV